MFRRDVVRAFVALVAAACGIRSAPAPTEAALASPTAAPTGPPAATERPTVAAMLFDAQNAELIDAHAHYVPEIVAALKSVGVRPTVFMPSSGATLLQLSAAAAANPGTLAYLPGQRRPADGRAVDDAALASVRQELPTGRWRGIGEVLLRRAPLKVDIPADSAPVLELLAIAAQHHLPVNVHVDGPFASELDRALAKSPNTVVIWAHAGSVAAPTVVRDLLRKHPRLYADISSRGEPYPPRLHIFGGDGSLRPERKSLLEDYPGRFLFGTDIVPAPQPGEPLLGPDASNIATTIARYRSLLGQLTAAAAERIAVANARQVLGARAER